MSEKQSYETSRNNLENHYFKARVKKTLGAFALSAGMASLSYLANELKNYAIEIEQIKSSAQIKFVETAVSEAKSLDELVVKTGAVEQLENRLSMAKKIMSSSNYLHQTHILQDLSEKEKQYRELTFFNLFGMWMLGIVFLNASNEEQKLKRELGYNLKEQKNTDADLQTVDFAE